MIRLQAIRGSTWRYRFVWFDKDDEEPNLDMEGASASLAISRNPRVPPDILLTSDPGGGLEIISVVGIINVNIPAEKTINLIPTLYYVNLQVSLNNGVIVNTPIFGIQVLENLQHVL